MSLTKAQSRQLDAFQNRCLRRVLGIAPAYYSRVSNAAVRETTGCEPITATLRFRRFQMLGEIFRSPPEHPLNTACFIPGTSAAATDRYVRRVGRPAKEWVKEMLHEAITLFGSMDMVTELAKDKRIWNSTMYEKLFGASWS